MLSSVGLGRKSPRIVSRGRKTFRKLFEIILDIRYRASWLNIYGSWKYFVSRTKNNSID